MKAGKPEIAVISDHLTKATEAVNEPYFLNPRTRSRIATHTGVVAKYVAEKNAKNQSTPEVKALAAGLEALRESANPDYAKYIADC